MSLIDHDHDYEFVYIFLKTQRYCPKNTLFVFSCIMIRMIQPEFWADQAFFGGKLLSQLAMNSVSSQNIEDGQLFCLTMAQFTCPLRLDHQLNVLSIKHFCF